MGQGLSIKKCDFKITMNNKNHHTEEISTERLIVRRGQPFTITVCFSAPIHSYLWQLKRTFLIVQTDDEVFLANEAQRQEYILNQDGVIYWGTENAVLAQPWDFSQFEEDIVDICFTLLDVGERHRDKDHTQRKNPVYIGRTVAAMLNCDEFRGILTECGTGQYFNGTPPSKWLGSGPILRQWVASQCKPVRYGQCWVFAAVMCSVLRCLGIPTRVVTGFTWAHNTNSSLSVDEYYDEDGTLLTQDKSARVWTFHVWNECWMARADLLPEYSGWQALDATCQEKRKGPSFCGPAPVQAIKEGDTEVDYDVCYFFAAINAKCQVWIQKTDDTLRPALGSTKYTGNNISTKSVGSERCEDITHNYKYPEGSLQEKVALDKAYTKIKELEATSSSSKTQFSSIPTTLEEPVNLFIHLQSKNSLLRGQDIPLSIEVFNHSGGEKSTHLVVGAQSLHYKGVPVTQLWKEEFHLILRSNEANNLQVFVPYSRYREELGEDHLLRLTATLKDEDSFYIYFAQEEISICDPPLTIEFPENMVQYQPSTAKISLLNPLTEPLEKCVIVVAGRGLIYRQRKYKLGSVQPKSTQQLQIPFTPTQAGPRRLTAHLTCLQFQNLKSYKTIDIATA
ncbi:erythrocyte membrane protein band 4.2-like isoform X4 [Strigops habroptila]|uniref:erythrocyte membrane protein band 4.2-like isoform X4 n=1 Tax=Strigops habroptila TaxID=2489341 RepID=UPI0011CF6C92|nr:erythrocyte membrane protein band 4.2-like isoform X4 [Strigops habroptila]